MIYVKTIKAADSGFGQYQAAVDGQEYHEFNTAEEYVEHVSRNNDLVTCAAYDPDVAEMGDEDGERLATAIRKATGAVQGGHGTIVAFQVGDEISLESVEVMEPQTVRIEYSLDSLGDITADAFRSACEARAAAVGYKVEFVEGLHNRETLNGEPCDLIVERAFAECCAA